MVSQGRVKAPDGVVAPTFTCRREHHDVRQIVPGEILLKIVVHSAAQVILKYFGSGTCVSADMYSSCDRLLAATDAHRQLFPEQWTANDLPRLVSLNITRLS
jgi:hypothetical protein